MTFLGLVGAPVIEIGYPAYQALKAATPALGAALEGTEAAAMGAIGAEGAAVLGAGVLGWMIGTTIRKQLGLDDAPPDLSTWVSGGVAGQRVDVTFTVYSEPNAPITTDVLITAPFAGVLRKNIGTDRDRFYLKQVSPPAEVTLFDFSPSVNPRARVQLNTLLKLDGTPAENLRKVPVYPQRPVFDPSKIPWIIPATPQAPEFPITPTVVPTPGNDPDEDDKELAPAITVQVPELGLQVQYTPTGVRIGGYSSPETEPYKAPKIPVPPTVPRVATDPCPCPEEDNPTAEVLCRVKRLQSDLLSAGYDYTTHAGVSGQGGMQSGVADELVSVDVTITSHSIKERTQRAADGTPTVYFIGWFSWMRGGNPSVRVPISYLHHNFIAPANADGYLYSLHDGSAAVSSYITRKSKDYVDNCAT